MSLRLATLKNNKLFLRFSLIFQVAVFTLGTASLCYSQQPAAPADKPTTEPTSVLPESDTIGTTPRPRSAPRLRKKRRVRKSFSRRFRETIDISGSARLSEYEKDKSFQNDKYYTSSGLWLNARLRKILGIRTYVDWRLQGQNLSRDNNTDGDLREAYGETSIGFLDLRVGRQIIVWGRADKVNPTDVWSLRNYRLLTVDDEDQRTGLFSVQAIANFESFRIIGLYQPEWRDPMLPIPPVDGVTVRNGSPDESSQQFGFKIDQSGGAVDWSVSYSEVIDKTPDLRITGLSLTEVGLTLNHQRLQVYGADAAFVLGDYGFRSEIAYTKTKDTQGTDYLTKNSTLFGVIGGDRSFDGVFTIGLQYLYKQVFDYQPIETLPAGSTRTLADQVNWISNQQAEQMHGATARISHKAFDETLESELAVVTWFYLYDSALRPKITYAFSDSWRAIVGGEYYMGPEKSFFGRLKRVNTAFAEIRYLF